MFEDQLEDQVSQVEETGVTNIGDRPKRRNVTGLTEITSELKVGDYVIAEFKTKRYGYFKISGTLVLMIDKHSLVVGSWIVCTDGKPANKLQTLTLKAKAGTHENGIFPGSDASEDLGTN